MAWEYRFRLLTIVMMATFGLAVFTYGQDGNAAKAKPFYDSGTAHMKQGDYDGAIVELTKAIDIDPKNPFAYAARGNAKTGIGALDEAIGDFSKAIELDPTRRVPYINRGVAKVDKGDLDGAIADYSKAIALDPKSASVFNNRGCAKLQKGDIDGARSDFQQAVQLASDEGAYQRFYLFLIGLRQKPGSSPTELRSVVSRWKESWKKTVGLFLAEEINEGALLEQAAQGTPKSVREQKCEGFYYAGAIRLAKGDVAAAKDLFDRCVATQLHTFPEFQLARTELAKLGEKLK